MQWSNMVKGLSVFIVINPMMGIHTLSAYESLSFNGLSIPSLFYGSIIHPFTMAHRLYIYD